MKDFKNFIIINRIVYFLLTILFIVLPLANVGDLFIWWYFALIFIILFICSLLLKQKNYLIEGHNVLVYAGWINAYLYVDGELEDEFRGVRRPPAILKADIAEDIHVEAITTSYCGITLKVNGKLQCER